MVADDMEKKPDIDAGKVMETEDVEELNVQLDEESALNLMGLMDAMGVADTGEAIRELIDRAHLREINQRPWKSRVRDRRKFLKDEMKEVNKKLKKIKKKSNWKKVFLKGEMSKLKRKRRKLKARLKEQLRTYRLVDKIE